MDNRDTHQNTLPELVGESTDANGRTIKRYSIFMFAGIEIYGPAEVNVRRGDAFSFSLTAASQDHERIKLRMLGDLVRLEWDDGLLGFRSPAGPLVYDFIAPEINEIRIAGTVTANIESLDVSRVSVLVEKNSTLMMHNLKTESLKVKLTQDSRATITGETDRLSVQAEDASRFDGFALLAREVDAKARHSARVSVAAEKELKANAEDLGEIVYRGNPAKRKTDVDEGGTVRAE